MREHMGPPLLYCTCLPEVFWCLAHRPDYNYPDDEDARLWRDEGLRSGDRSRVLALKAHLLGDVSESASGLLK